MCYVYEGGDCFLASLYGVETRTLNQAVKRQRKRFPDDFMFQLTKTEFNNLNSQFVTSSWGGIRKMPSAFTEQGVAMLSGILNSDRAIQVNIQIMRVFTQMREMLQTHKDVLTKLEQLESKDLEQDDKIIWIFHYLKQLELEKQSDQQHQNRKRVGFKRKGES